VTDHQPSRLLRWASVPLMLGAGALVAAQSEINGRLAHELGTGLRAGFAAALVSFGSGLLVLAVLTAALPHQRRGVRRFAAAVRTGTLPPYLLLGGLFGAFLVASQGLTVATIGVALFSVAVTAGQSSSALLVDHVGIGPSGRHGWSTPRLVAAAFAVTAVVLATGERLVAQFSWQVALFAVLPFLAGAGAAVQQATNGRVSHEVGPWITTLNNFAVGTTGLAVAFGLSLLAAGDLAAPPTTWWLYAGGVMGMTFIWLAALLVRVHGVLVLGLSMIAGQVIGSQLIEAAAGAHVGPLGVAAGGLVVLGVVVAIALRPRS
jgi:transporter family-2 protein